MLASKSFTKGIRFEEPLGVMVRLLALNLVTSLGDLNWEMANDYEKRTP